MYDVIEEDITIEKIKNNIFKIKCNKNKNEKIIPTLNFTEKMKLFFNFFANPYFPWNMYIRYKQNYYYNYRIFNDKKLAKRFYNFYLKDLNKNKNFKILDYGCGNGRVIGLLNQLGFKNIIGQDIYLFKEWERYNAKFLITPTECNEFYPYKNKIFDVIFSIQVIMYLNDEQLVNYVRSISEILKGGGYFIFEDRNENMINPNNYIKNKCCSYIHKRERIIHLLKENNFEIIKEKTFGIDTKYLSKYIKWLRNFIVQKHSYDVFDFYEKSWFDKLLKYFLPNGKEPLHLLICRKR